MTEPVQISPSELEGLPDNVIGRMAQLYEENQQLRKTLQDFATVFGARGFRKLMKNKSGRWLLEAFRSIIAPAPFAWSGDSLGEVIAEAAVALREPAKP